MNYEVWQVVAAILPRVIILVVHVHGFIGVLSRSGYQLGACGRVVEGLIISTGLSSWPSTSLGLLGLLLGVIDTA